jgi:hypothetical protein
MRKFLGILLFFTIIMSLVIPFNSTKGITNVFVSVSPSDRISYGEYKITFTTEKELKAGADYIAVLFPEGSVLHCSSCALAHCSDCIRINGLNASGAGYMDDYNGKAAYFKIPGGLNLKPQDKVELVLKQIVENPILPGKYTLKVWTSQEPEKVISNEFEVTSTKIQKLSISIIPEYTKAKSKVTVSFQTGKLGSIQNGRFIYIKFPEGFELSNSGKSEFITVNTEIPSEVKVDGQALALRISESIGATRDVTINIYSSFGTVNPPTKGIYTFTVWTDSEIDPVTTTVEIKEKDFVKTLIQTNPIEPDGINGFFKSPITLTLLGETNIQESIETFYKVDEGEFKKYEAPFSVTEGTHTVYFYSTTKTLKEDVQSKVIKLDLTPPEITLNFEDPTYTAENSFVISGGCSEKSVLYINGIYVDIKSDLTFAKDFELENGENTFTFRVTDEAGNSIIKQAKIVLDPTTPVLTIESPSNWQKFAGNGILVKGSVYPKNCNVYVNNEKVTINEEGIFNLTYLPKTSNPLQPVNILAVYSFTGKSVEKKYIVTYEPKTTEIILTIGKKEIMVNGKLNLMDVAPFIDKTSGRTLVPVRFISEFLDFEVTWDAIAKKVTIMDPSKTIILSIGQKTASINGNAYEMDVAPLILDSRTFVPLRFISEAFGYLVNWDAKTQSITISQ